MTPWVWYPIEFDGKDTFYGLLYNRYMSNFFQNTELSYEEAEKRLNNRLNGLEVVSILNGVSDTSRLYFTIYSQEHDQNYELLIGTDNWTWEDATNKEILVLKDELDEHSMHPITSDIENFLQNKLMIKKIELQQKSMLLRLYFDNGSVLEAKEDLSSENKSHYQLLLLGSKLYQNYNLLVLNDSCIEEITNGEEQGAYKVALFDLDYFRAEHRTFTSHAIQQARQRKTPVSFLQARALYDSLTTSSILAFTPWRLRRSSEERTRLETIPVKELIAITRHECKKNNFTVTEAEDILKSTVDSLKEWIQTEKDIGTIAEQEYAHKGIFRGLVKWYEETLKSK